MGYRCPPVASLIHLNINSIMCSFITKPASYCTVTLKLGKYQLGMITFKLCPPLCDICIILLLTVLSFCFQNKLKYFHSVLLALQPRHQTSSIWDCRYEKKERMFSPFNPAWFTSYHDTLQHKGRHKSSGVNFKVSLNLAPNLKIFKEIFQRSSSIALQYT